jgi:hypothetical protein
MLDAITSLCTQSYYLSEMPTACARVCQCRGCGTRLLDRMSTAYASEILRVEAKTESVIVLSRAESHKDRRLS